MPTPKNHKKKVATKKGNTKKRGTGLGTGKVGSTDRKSTGK
jgi:hypothetical protein